jgi:hypothetical protein
MRMVTTSFSKKAVESVTGTGLAAGNSAVAGGFRGPFVRGPRFSTVPLTRGEDDASHSRREPERRRRPP